MKRNLLKILPLLLLGGVLGLAAAPAAFEVTKVDAATFVFSKVTKNSDLSKGDRVILVDEGRSLAATKGLISGDSGKRYIDRETVTISGTNASFDADGDVCIFTLDTGKVAGSFALQNEENKYLAPYALGKAGMKYETSISNASSWTIDVENATPKLSMKSNIDGAAWDSLIYLMSNGDMRMYKSSSGCSPISIYKYSSGDEQIQLNETEVQQNVGTTFTLTASGKGSYVPESYVWSIEEGSEYVSLSTTTGNSTIVTFNYEGSAVIKCLADGKADATCAVTVTDYQYNVISGDKYFVLNSTGSTMMNAADSKFSSEVDFDLSDDSFMIGFEKAYVGDNTYYLSFNGEYITRAKCYDSKAQNTELGKSENKYDYWTISGDSNGYTIKSSSANNTSIGEGDDSRFRAIAGGKVKLCESLVFDKIVYDGTLTKNTYDVGDTFDPKGLTFYAQYTDGTKLEIKSDRISFEKVNENSVTGTVSVGGSDREVTVTGLDVYYPVVGSMTVECTRESYFIGERVNKDDLTVKVTYNNGSVDDVRTLTSKDFSVEPEIVAADTESVRVTFLKSTSVYKDVAIEAVKNHFVAANYIAVGDVITIGTLGYDPYELKGGEEFTYDGTEFDHESYGYLPTGNQQFEVGKVDGYYTLKNTANGLYLRGDASAFKKYSSVEEEIIYTDKDGRYNVSMTVTFDEQPSKSYTIDMFTDPYETEFENYKAFYCDTYKNLYAQGYSDLENDEFVFELYDDGGTLIDMTSITVDWRYEAGAFIYSVPGDIDDPINDEALWSLTYDDYSEAWQMTCKAYPTKQCYWNKDGKFGFYTIGSYDGSRYFNIMLFRDNTKPLQGTLTGVSVSFQEGMDVVSQGEPFPWTSALIVTAYYSGGAFKQVPIGGYQVELPDTSVIGKATGKVIFGQEGHEVEKEFTITVKGHTQAFEIKGDRDPVLVGEECQLRVEPATPEGEPIKWSVDHPEFASISETGLLKGITPGYINVTATSFDGVYSDTVKIRIYQQVESVTLDKHEVELNAGETSQLTATVKPDNASNKNVTYSSSDTSVAFVDAKTGLITAVSEGTATITCVAENHPERNFDICEVTVKPAPIVHVTGITLDCDYKELELNKTFTLVATIAPSNATVKGITWSSDHDNIATVDSTGKVKGVATGECVITATTADGGKTASCTVKVKKTVTPVPVSSISLDITNKKIDVDETFEIVATINPSNATDKHIDWSSSNEDVVEIISVGPSGVTVKGMSNGTATITASCGGKTATCTVTVVDPSIVINVESVSLNKSSCALEINDQVSLIPTINPTDATDKSVIWSSSNENVATVDANGKVTAVAEGTATITVTTNDGSKTATCVVTVSSSVVHVSSISLDKTEIELETNKEADLVATVNPENATNKELIWTSSDDKIVTVENGHLVAIGEGVATITVTSVDGGKTATCEVTVKNSSGSNDQTIIVAGAVVGTVAVAGIGCGVGIPLGLKAKKRKLHK